MSTRDGKAYAIDGQPLDLTDVPAGLEYTNAYAAADRMAAREGRPITLTINGQRVATAHPFNPPTQSETLR